jgi:hypothetical protein
MLTEAKGNLKFGEILFFSLLAIYIALLLFLLLFWAEDENRNAPRNASFVSLGIAGLNEMAI